MIDSVMLYKCFNKKVKLTDNNGKGYVGTVVFYESEYDSGSGVAEIGLNITATLFKADEIKSIEIVDETAK